ncbi:MAG: hypothetical protein LBN23_04610 [Paludibacter sp.]|nr:hypothetical protein [Paludibacter sp.]
MTMDTLIRKKRISRLHPQYIKDRTGNRLVVLQQEDYSAIVDELEDWEDNLLYLQGKLNDTGERISMDDAFREIELNRQIA